MQVLAQFPSMFATALEGREVTAQGEALGPLSSRDP
jgi:hypothetical protein